MKLSLQSTTHRPASEGLISLSRLRLIQVARLTFIWLALVLSLSQSSFAKTPAWLAGSAAPNPDYQPLVDLYNATNGPGWTNNSGWLTGDSPCSWYGVICHSETGRVLSVDLSNNNLVGTLPLTLPQLTKLKVFNVGNNQLGGTIPANLSQIATLQLLYLNDGQFTGTLPDALSSLSELLLLDVSHNQLTGPVPSSLSMLSKVKQLSLSFNNFTGTIPTSLGQLPNLQVLYLNSNKLTGSIPNELSMLPKLQLLELSRNQLTGGIPTSLGNLSKLLLLFLNNNKLTGSIPASLSNLTKLQFLFLQNNKLSGCLPPSLSVFCGQTVDISGNPSLPGDGNFAAFCSSGAGSCGAARQAAGIENTGLQVAIQGNPVVGRQLSAEVWGDEGQSLSFHLLDMAGKLVNERLVKQAGEVERQNLEVSDESTGLLLLRVTSPEQSKTIKILKTR